MIMLIIFVVCSLYFFYLHVWVQSYLRKEYTFASPSRHEPLPHSASLSILVGIFWGATVIAGIFWGYTYNRYPDYLSLRNIKIEVFLLIAICIAVGLSNLIVYRLGELRGVANMKNTKLFMDWANKHKIEAS